MCNCVTFLTMSTFSLDIFSYEDHLWAWWKCLQWRAPKFTATLLLMTITWRHLSPCRAISKMYRNSQIWSAFSEILVFIHQNHKGVCKVGVIKKFLYIWKWHGMGNFKVSFIVNMWLAGIGMKNYDENVFIVLVKCLLAGFIHIYLDR